MLKLNIVNHDAFVNNAKIVLSKYGYSIDKPNKVLDSVLAEIFSYDLEYEFV